MPDFKRRRAISIAGRYKAASGFIDSDYRDDMEPFLDVIEKDDRASQMMDKAEEIYKDVGFGVEAKVFRLAFDAVLKISSPKNIRGEYVVFSDPTFKDITPNVYGVGENHKWMIVEKVDVLQSKHDVKEYFPTIYETFERREIEQALDAMSEGKEDFIESLWRKEKRFLTDLQKLYESLGSKRILDLYHENLG
jgi:hypothetical protein